MSEERGERRPRPRGGRRPRRKVCSFCVDKMSGNCAKHQRQLSEAIKRARAIALMPYTVE